MAYEWIDGRRFGWFFKKYAYLKRDGFPDQLIRKFKIYEQSQLEYERYHGTTGWYKHPVWSKIDIPHDMIEKQVNAWHNTSMEAEENFEIHNEFFEE